MPNQLPQLPKRLAKVWTRLFSKTGGTLCDRCTTINLDKTFDGSWHFKEYIDREVILTLKEPKEAVWLSSCAFCQLLKAVDPRYYEDQDRNYEHYSVMIYRYKSSEVNLNNCIAVDPFVGAPRSAYSSWLPGRYLFFVGPNTPIRVIDPGPINFEILKSWIGACQGEHVQECGLARPNDDKMPLLQLINVETRTIENAKEEVQYAALSYVWGQQQSTALPDQSSSKQGYELTDELPATIGDAITVTMRLGFRYLWVDRYCIPQGDDKSREKHDQINRMDQIYRGAELTIIAAAGNDPNFGLPGVGSTGRVQQTSAKIGKYILASTMTDPRQIISSSPWMSRAWTHQEAVCSRRRLVFTVEQVYFECQKMSCRESVDFDWNLRDYHVFQEMPLGLFSWSIFDHISEYSKRQMTYPEDALNGLLGVFRLFRQQKHAVHHFWGVPIIPPTPERRKDDMENDQTFEQGFITSLCWKSEGPGARRPCFPSWSWAAWACPISQMFQVTGGYHPSETALGVSIGHNDGSFISFHEAFNMYIKTDLLESLSCRIRIKGWTIDLFAKLLPTVNHRVEDDGFLTLYAWPASIDQVDAQLATEVFLNKRINREEESLWQIQSRRLISIMIEEFTGLWDFMHGLVLEEVSEGKFERVGHLVLVGNGYYCTMREISISSRGHVEIDMGEELQGSLNTSSRHGLGLQKMWLSNRVIREVELV